MEHAAHVSLTYADGSAAERVHAAVRPEVGDIGGDRTRIGLDRTEATLDLRVDATDLVALRAGINTWLSLVSVAERSGAGAGDPRPE